MGAAVVPLMIGGAAVQLAGGVMGAAARQKAMRAEAAAREENARLLELEAGDAEERGRYEAGRVREKGGRAAADVRTAASASGLDVDTGTTADVQLSSRVEAEKDARLAITNAAREAWGLRMQAGQERRGAASVRAARGGALVGDLLGLAGNALGSAADVYSTRKKLTE